MLADPVISDDQGRVWAVCRFANKRRLVHLEVDEALAMVLAAETPPAGQPPTPTAAETPPAGQPPTPTATASSTEFTPPKAGPAAQSTMRSAKTTGTSTTSKASSSHMTSPKRIARWNELQKKSIDELNAERENLEGKHRGNKNKQMLRDVVEALCQKKEEVAE
jgi:hypothetical protein